MTRDQVKQILIRIQTVYPTWHPQGDLSVLIDTWHEYIGCYDYDCFLNALRAYDLTNSTGFAPSIGQIVCKMKDLSQDSEMNGLEAWALVSKALKNGYYGAEEEFNKLPRLVQKAVGSPSNLRNWSQTDTKSIENVVMSQFIKAYNTEASRESQMSMIPSQLIESVRSNLLGKKEEQWLISGNM